MEQFNTTSPISDIRAQQSSGSAMPSPEPAAHNKTLKTVLIAIVAILIVWGVWALLQRAGIVSLETNSNVSFQQLEPGMTPDGFPQEFIPEEGTVIEESFMLGYKDTGDALPVVSYTSARSLAETITQFETILERDGWNMVRAASVDEAPITNFYAIKDGAEVNITLSVVDGRVRVTVAVVQKN